MSKGIYEGGRPIPPEAVQAVLLSKTVSHVVGVTPTLLSRPSPTEKVLYLFCDQGNFRYRVGDYTGDNFADGDVTVDPTNTIDITSHGYQTGDGPFQLTNSGGALPTGLAAGTNYWVIAVDDDTIQLALSEALALAGTAVAITAAAGGGTHNIGGPAGWAPLVMPASSVSGYGAYLLSAGAGVAIAAPERLTVVGFSATDVLTYAFVEG